MAKVFYTTIERVVNGEYIRGRHDAPVKVDFGPNFKPEGRLVKRKTQRTEVEKVKKEVVSPKGERFTIDIDLPRLVEAEVEEFVLYTKTELAAMGLIMVDEKDEAPKGQALKPHFNPAGQAGTPAAHTQDKAGGRPSDREPTK